MGRYSKNAAAELSSIEFDRKGIGAQGRRYERLDQFTTELLLGSRG
jgi:hypothetical protein